MNKRGLKHQVPPFRPKLVETVKFLVQDGQRGWSVRIEGVVLPWIVDELVQFVFLSQAVPQ